MNGGTSNEFSHGAFKLFHANIPDLINFYDDSKRIDFFLYSII